MLDRRGLLAGLTAVAATPALAFPRLPKVPALPKVPLFPARTDLLDKAIARAGGRRALEQAKVLRWTGQAKVSIPGRAPLIIGVRAVIQPFSAYRTDSWIGTQSPDKPNSLIIEGGQGFVQRFGQARQPMPADQFAHENAQYAIYGLMRLVSLKDAKVSPGAGPNQLLVQHPSAPETTLTFAPDAKLIAAANTVPSPEGKAPIAQQFEFDGEIEDHGVRWPKVLRIAEDGQPYFELTLATFSAAPA